MQLKPTFDEIPIDRSQGPTVLIVDDEVIAQKNLKTLISTKPELASLHLIYAASPKEAFALLASTPVHVVLLDKHLGKGENAPDGVEIIPKLLQIASHLQILMVTGSNDTQDIVQAMRYGAFGYVTKDSDPELITNMILKGVHVAKLEIERASLAIQCTSEEPSFIARSATARRVLAQIEAVAESNRPVLLLGETGTGKTTLAKYINELRKGYLKQDNRPFFQVNLSSFPPSLIEAELFGHEKGAFTGALNHKIGFFELVNHGTLFLDEIGEVSLELQKKLLTVLEDGVFYRIGGKLPMRSSFKLVCATNRNLKEMVAQGKFREDLYMRICTFTIEVPALRDRIEDIPLIIQSLLPKCCNDNNVFVAYRELPKDFIKYLSDNIPPGNIRGLEQQISRLLVFAPRDHKDRPLLQKWRDVSGLEAGTEQISRKSLSLKDLMECPTDMVGPDFPGLAKVTQVLQDKIVSEACRKLKQNNKVARVLKLSESTMSIRIKRLSAVVEGQLQ